MEVRLLLVLALLVAGCGGEPDYKSIAERCVPQVVETSSANLACEMSLQACGKHLMQAAALAEELGREHRDTIKNEDGCSMHIATDLMDSLTQDGPILIHGLQYDLAGDTRKKLYSICRVGYPCLNDAKTEGFCVADYSGDGFGGEDCLMPRDSMPLPHISYYHTDTQPAP